MCADRGGSCGGRRRRAAGGISACVRCLVLLSVLLPGCRQEDPAILVLAAASLAGAVEDAAAGWSAANGIRVEVSAGASVALQRQIQAGAPADLFIAAAAVPVEALIAAGLARAGERRDLAGNTLVVAVPLRATHVPGKPEDLLRLERLALADPELAPAGAYGRQALQHLGLWDSLQARLLLAADVRAALTYVTRGVAPAALVYDSDARLVPGLQRAFTLPAASHAPIVYAGIVLASSSQHHAAASFLDHLAHGEGAARLRAAGFVAPPEGP